jgi:hypothetical protein
MVGTQDDQSLRKGMKTTGQLACERRSVSGRRDFPCDCRRGEEGDWWWNVVLRNRDIVRALVVTVSGLKSQVLDIRGLSGTR